MAFANSEGGHIIFGVKENKDLKSFEVIGIRNTFSIDDITLRRQLSKFLSTTPEIGVVHHLINGLRFAAIYIKRTDYPISAMKVGNKPGTSKPVFKPGDIYYRVGNECLPVTDVRKFSDINFGRY